MARQLLIGTNNPGKLRELTTLLAPFKLALVTPRDLDLTDDPTEDGETFEENSLLKSNFYWQRARIPVLADDAGLEVDALHGQPGVHTRRWIGRRMSDREICDEVLRRLDGVPEDRRTARLRCVVTLRLSADMNFQATGTVEGVIRPSQLPIPEGFPAETILWLPRYTKFYGQLTWDEHLHESNRAKAIDQLKPYFQQYL